MSKPTITITQERYDDLVDTELMMSYLEAAGIDNTTAYEHGMEDYYAHKGETS